MKGDVLKIGILSIVLIFFRSFIPLEANEIGQNTFIKASEASALEIKAIKTFKRNETVNFINYIAADTSIYPKKAKKIRLKFNQYLSDLKSKSAFNNDIEYIKYLYKKAHKDYLINYKKHQNFSKIFTDKTYDCLTASIFFSEIFDKKGINYDFKIAPHHVYLKVYADNKYIIIETTDPVWGIKEKQKKIKNFKSKYKSNVSNSYKKIIKASGYYTSDKDMNKIKTGDKKEICGYLYYNFAINYFNNKNFKKTIHTLEKGLNYHASPRILGLLVISIQYYINENDIDPHKQVYYKKKLRKYKNYKLSAYALK